MLTSIGVSCNIQGGLPKSIWAQSRSLVDASSSSSDSAYEKMSDSTRSIAVQPWGDAKMKSRSGFIAAQLAMYLDAVISASTMSPIMLGRVFDDERSIEAYWKAQIVNAARYSAQGR